MGKDCIIALDLGTTGNRAIAFADNGEKLASNYEEFPNYFPKADWVEQEPMELWDSALKVLKKTLSELAAGQCKGIGITNQRETIIAWNPKTGRPYHRAIVWQCRRSQEICEHFKEKEALIQEKTGLILDPYFSATKMRWILENVPEARAGLEKGELYFGTVDSWVLWQLSNGKRFATDPSNASRTMLYNIEKQDYDPELLALFAIPKSALPEVLDSDKISAQTDAEILGEEIPIAAILGDQQAALFAQDGLRPGCVKATFGTGLFMVSSTGTKQVETEKMIRTIAWKRDNQLDYAIEGSAFTAGSAIQWCRDQLGLIQNPSETEGMALSLKDNAGVYFIPALSGLGAPYWKPHATGQFIGLTQATSKAHLIRAVLESMAYQSRLLMEGMQDEKSRFSVLKVDGGASQNAFLMQFLADICQVRIQRPESHESTALGVAALAGNSLKIWKDSDFLSQQKISSETSPQLSHDLAEKQYLSWKTALENSL